MEDDYEFTDYDSAISSGAYYPIRDLLAIMDGRHEEPVAQIMKYFSEPPFNVPYWLERAGAAGELANPRQRSKLYKRYYQEWDVYLKLFTEPVDGATIHHNRN